MGDRSNIVIEQGDGSRVWLYGHWMGEDSINVVRDTLAHRERWSDAPYLARMLFNRMTRGSELGDTGYGISTSMCDNEYPIIVLDPATQTVKLEDAPWPATKEELIDYAVRSGAWAEVVENLEELEDDGEIYESIEDIWPDYPTKDDFFFNEEEY